MKLAIALKTTQQMIDKWERGIISPGMDRIIQLATFFKVTADYLLGLSNEYNEKQNNEFVATLYGNNAVAIGKLNELNIKK